MEPTVVQQAVELTRFFGALNERLNAARNAELHEYQRFFDGLAPRLETTRVLERELDVKLARRFNVFDYLKSKCGYRVNEATLSRVIADLLDPSGSHGQDTLFLKCLLRGLDLDWTSDISLQSARIEVERQTDDNRRLDVSVHIDKDHCLAIENKPYAPDRTNQFKDYLYELMKYEKSLLIYLSAGGKPPAEKSLTLDDLDVLQDDHLFKIMPYDNTGGSDREDDFDQYRIDYSLADWLGDCRKSCDIDRLRWFLSEAETFCERQFGGNNVTDAETSTIKEFVLSDERSLKTALTLAKSLPNIVKDVKNKVCRDAFGLILESDELCGLARASDAQYADVTEDEQALRVAMRRESWPEQVWIELANERQCNGWHVSVTWYQDGPDKPEEQDLRPRLSEQLKKLELSEEEP